MKKQRDRRRFLKIAGLSGVVFASGLADSASAARKSGATTYDDFHFVKLSDSLWGFEDEAVNPGGKDTLKKAVTAINGLDEKPDLKKRSSNRRGILRFMRAPSTERFEALIHNEEIKMTLFRYTHITAMLLALISVSAAHSQTDTAQPVEISPDAIKWMSPPTLPGVQLAWLINGENKPGLYELRVRLAPGAIVPPHTHPDMRCATVLSGELYAGHGNTVEPEHAKRYLAGSFHCVPAGVPHYVFAKDSEVMFQDSGIAPTGTNWVKK